MANKPSITHLKRGATALTAEAGKLIRNRALSAAHQALVLALHSVQAADRKLVNASAPRRKAAGRSRVASVKRKVTRTTSKARRRVAR